MTRAEERLYLTRAGIYDGRKNAAKSSPFLNDLHCTEHPLLRLVRIPAFETMADGLMLSDLEQGR
ncbi:MAG: hypothetical protein Q7J09_11610 [Methanocalculus sp.]|uniref:hypothetical protein n=1 Tax=Methanocalculus sp. TaxID=2004547 RepID=UPI002716397C|nr:hypothetical protein [Methanocalculus sp.]MDO8841472.1 hypothetical protein [Methanocalculus sp.]MDO9540631.1 hypothetical protein [Methanocalculus sp.]